MPSKPHTRSMGSLTQGQGREQTPDLSSSLQGQPAGEVESSSLPYIEHWCYANSIFQAFLHAPKFVKWLEQEHESCTIEYCLACALRELSRTYWEDSNKWEPLDIAHDCLRDYLEQSFHFEDVGWDWTIQQDAAEFYEKFVIALKERDTGVMIDVLFNFEITNTMTCPNCSEQVCIVNSEPSLHVHFEDGAPLEDLLRDVTFGQGVYENRECDVCHRRTDTLNVHGLATGPRILVMCLDRFTYSRKSGSRKNNAVIPFNEELDLSPYTDGNFPLKYRLLSVVQHRGSRKDGHYITIAKDRSGKWMKLDDDKEPSPAVGIDPFCPKSKAGFTPFILFWSRVDEEEDVAAESPTDDGAASTNDGKASTDDDDNDDDKMQPLQININGMLQPPSRKYFVKKSALVELDQQHVEKIYASINNALSEMEAKGGEKNEEEEEEKEEEEEEEAERKKEVEDKKEAEDKKEKKAAEQVEKEKEKTTEKTSKKGAENKKEKTKTEPKKTKTSIQNDTGKTSDETQKAQKKKGEGENKNKKQEAQEGEGEEEEKKTVSKKRKSPSLNSTSQQESKGASKKQKSSDGDNSSQEKKKPGHSKKKK